MRGRGVNALLFLLLAGCGPVAIGAGLNELLKSDATPDLTTPSVAFLGLEGENAPPAFTSKFEVPFRLEFSKVSGSLRVSARLIGPKTQAEMDAFVLAMDADGVPLPDGFEPVTFDGESGVPDLGTLFEGVYRFVVVVEDANGRRGWNQYTWTIDTKVPTAPELLSVGPVDPSTVELTWNKSFADISGVARYVIEYEERASFGGGVTRRDRCEVEVSALTELDENRVRSACTGLRPGTIQRFFVVAEAGNGLQSEPSNTLGTRLGNGHAGTFTARAGASAWDLGAKAVAVRTADFDGDGHVDVVAALDRGTEQIVLLLGRGDGTFDVQASRLTLPFAIRNLRVAEPQGYRGLETPYVIACGETVSTSGAPAGAVAVLEPVRAGDEGAPADERAEFSIARLYADRSRPVLDVASHDWSRPHGHDVITVGGSVSTGRVEMLRSKLGGGFLELNDDAGTANPAIFVNPNFSAQSFDNVSARWTWSASCQPIPATDLNGAARLSAAVLADLGGGSGDPDLIVAADRSIWFFDAKDPCFPYAVEESGTFQDLIDVINAGITPDRILRELARLLPGAPRIPRLEPFPDPLQVALPIASIAAGNLDADQRDELVVALRDGVVLIHDASSAAGKFEQGTSVLVGGSQLGECLLGQFAGIVDVPANARPDVLVCNASSPNSILVLAHLEEEGLAFRSQVSSSDAGGAPDHVAAADFDEDGLLDVVVNDRNSTSIHVLLGNGGTTSRTGEFAYMGPILPTEPGLGRPVVGTADDGSLVLAGAGTNSVPLGFLTTLKGRPLDLSGLRIPGVAPTTEFLAFAEPRHLRLVHWNKDGRQDHVVAGPDGVVVGLGQPGGASPEFSVELIGASVDGFEDLLPKASRRCDGLAIANFDDDDPLDLAVACFGTDEDHRDGHLIWLFGADTNAADPASTWTARYLDEAAAGARTTVHLDAADLDEDGRPDLLVADPATNQLFAVLYDARMDGLTENGTEIEPDGFDPRRLRKARFDLSGLGKDRRLGQPIAATLAGRPGVVLFDRSTTGEGGRVHFLVAQDAGSFTTTSSIDEFEVLESIANADGGLDVADYVIAGYASEVLHLDDVVATSGRVNDTLLIYRRSTLALDSPAVDAIAADLDGDGDTDVAVLLENGEVAVFRWAPAGTFEADEKTYSPKGEMETTGALTGIAAADMNGDGILDLVVTDAGDAEGTGAGFRILLGEERVDDLAAEEQEPG